MTQSAATVTTADGVNPIRVKSGSVAALCTAQPRTGAAPIASARGNRCRASAYPSNVHNAVATSAASAAFSGDAMSKP